MSDAEVADDVPSDDEKDESASSYGSDAKEDSDSDDQKDESKAEGVKFKKHSGDNMAYEVVADGIFYAELHDFLTTELAENGYAGVEVNKTPKRVEIVIRAVQVREVIGDKNRRIRELRAIIQQRWNLPGTVLVYCEKLLNKGLSALSQAQAVKFRLISGHSVRKAAYAVVQFIMNKGAQGCEVVITGKLRGQRAKGMKFRDGKMIHSGEPMLEYVDKAVKHVHLRQGAIGIKVKILLPHDPNGRDGVKAKPPSKVTVHKPSDKHDKKIESYADKLRAKKNQTSGAQTKKNKKGRKFNPIPYNFIRHKYNKKRGAKVTLREQGIGADVGNEDGSGFRALNKDGVWNKIRSKNQNQQGLNKFQTDLGDITQMIGKKGYVNKKTLKNRRSMNVDKVYFENTWNTGSYVEKEQYQRPNRKSNDDQKQ